MNAIDMAGLGSSVFGLVRQARHGPASSGKAWQGVAGVARQVLSRLVPALCGAAGVAWRVATGQVEARLGRAWQARLGAARRGKAGLGAARHGSAVRGVAGAAGRDSVCPGKVGSVRAWQAWRGSDRLGGAPQGPSGFVPDRQAGHGITGLGPVSLGWARCGEAGSVYLGQAAQGQARHGRHGSAVSAWRDGARQDVARLGGVWPGMAGAARRYSAWCGKSRCASARRGRAGRARPVVSRLVPAGYSAAGLGWAGAA